MNGNSNETLVMTRIDVTVESRKIFLYFDRSYVCICIYNRCTLIVALVLCKPISDRVCSYTQLVAVESECCRPLTEQDK